MCVCVYVYIHGSFRAESATGKAKAEQGSVMCVGVHGWSRGERKKRRDTETKKEVKELQRDDDRAQ